ncbi:MAG: hypothetical protein Q9164_001050 [Protoblastenia rupestris]
MQTVRIITKDLPHSLMNNTPYLPITQGIFILQLFTSLVAFLWAYIYLRAYLNRRHDPEACKQIGLVSVSNITDEHDARYDGARQEAEGQGWKVKSLWIYPVKSCKGVELDHCAVTGIGLQHDRHFSFAQYTKLSYGEAAASGWRFMTQREIPALAKVAVEMWVPDPLSSAYRENHPNVQSGGLVRIRWPGYSQGASTWYKMLRRLSLTAEMSVQVPYDPTPQQIKSNGYQTEKMKIWKDTPPSLLLARTASHDGHTGKSAWIRDLRRYLDDECHFQHPASQGKDGKSKPGFTFDLSKPFALFRVSVQHPREVYRNAPPKEELGYQPTVGFQDSYPLHILNLASVHDLAHKLTPGTPSLSIKNFRPNIMITRGTAYVEDDWKRIKIGADTYYVSSRTTRCLLPNVDPSTGRADPSEPNRTLRSFRIIDKGAKNTACLGMQMVPAVEERREMKVGDEIEILETGEHFCLK